MLHKYFSIEEFIKELIINSKRIESIREYYRREKQRKLFDDHRVSFIITFLFLYYIWYHEDITFIISSFFS